MGFVLTFPYRKVLGFTSFGAVVKAIAGVTGFNKQFKPVVKDCGPARGHLGKAGLAGICDGLDDNMNSLRGTLGWPPKDWAG